MHRRIDTALQRIRQDLDCHLDKSVIIDACKRSGHVWRECLLTLFAIILWFLLQVLNGNTALTHVSHLAGQAFTAEAYCQARARLPLAVFRAVLQGMAKALVPITEQENLWRGDRSPIGSLVFPGNPFVYLEFFPPDRPRFRTVARATRTA
jgi:hypothetical protein